jgi:hypothetical protein
MGGIADKDAEAVAVALAKVVGYQGSCDAHIEKAHALDTVDAEHVDLPLMNDAGIEVQRPALEEYLIGVDHPCVGASAAVVHNMHSLALLAGTPEVLEDGSVTAKAFL